ncbi:hypothetical protein O6H91_15G074400 [Diphasiastrum complanatum]|uniref:Uncharacterized protein n=1 Tax=Diphasiastrum complanatum TaxID=34168 RepID=A0ACC2BJS7_DIPCM|nr:hypothetical protein O6H91_15G074400 [Diphasiastrum complanatum]
MDSVDDNTNVQPMPKLDSQDPVKNHGESSAGASGGSEDGSFDCNICLELAQDPVVTLCGHLFCWPCLHRWVKSRIGSNKDCPVCKAIVKEDKVVPLYGRGKVGSVDPRSKAVPGVDIPHRPSGQRPDAARHPEQQHQPYGFTFVAGSGIPVTAARFGNITLSAGFGLFPSLFGFHLHGYDGTGTPSGFHFRIPGNHRPAASPSNQYQQQEVILSRILLFLGCFVIVCLIFF